MPDGKKPEKYLDLGFRNSISVFAKFPKEVVNPIIDRLSKDLKNGLWDEKYDHIRRLKEYNGGYYFLKIKKDNIIE